MNIPIYNSIRDYVASEPVPFHMPGHKLGKGIPGCFLKDMIKMDLTEIPGMDNLHYPEGPVLQAQQLAADAFGADRTFFLVNGSTCGVHAMIMTVCKPGDKLIVARDCHKAAINGMILAGVRPVYIKPEYDELFGIPAHVEYSEVERALVCHPDAAGVLVTRPNYYGICSDIEKISEITHSHGKVLLVDEAHGAHLRFSPKLPVCAMDAGADICVQSAHKTLPALTQGAYLHVGSDRIDAGRLEYNLRMLQTTSPSYIIMAFLDIARAIMAERGKELTGELLRSIEWFRSGLKGIETLKMLDGSNFTGAILDRTRLVVNVRGMGISGYEAERVLRQKYGIQVEMSDMGNIVCISTTADSRHSFEALLNGLNGIASEFKNMPGLADIPYKGLTIPEKGMEPSDTVKCTPVEVKLRDAVGRISLNMITPYPPGIPLLCPGEIISHDTAEYIYGIVKYGGSVNGIGTGMKVRVAG